MERSSALRPLAAFALRYFGRAADDRVLIVNFGADLCLSPAPEPLLAPPEECRWRLFWSSEDPVYGGSGISPLETDENWRIPGFSAILMVPDRMSENKP
jgi:maltooligosyltrehalose trehalohydrolase